MFLKLLQQTVIFRARGRLFFLYELWSSQNHVELLHRFTQVFKADMALLNTSEILAALCLLLRHIDHFEFVDYFEHLVFHHGGSNLVDALVAGLNSNRSPNVLDQVSLDLRHVPLDGADEVLPWYDVRV